MCYAALLVIVLAGCVAGRNETTPAGGVLIMTTELSGHAHASFQAVDDLALTSSVVGSCEISRAHALTAPGDVVDAGPISISGAREAFTLTPNLRNDYDDFSAMEELFSGGETITISAAGGEVPPFTEQLTAPSKITVTTPGPPDSMGLVIPRAQDLVVSWTGGSGRVLVFLYNALGDTITCYFPASDGTGTIPEAVLSNVSYYGGTCGIEIDSVDHVETHAGGWLVRLTAAFVGEQVNVWFE